MFSFESAFSRKRCIFVGQGGAACGDPPLSDSRVSLPGQLRVPWVRADQTKFANHWDNSVTAAKLRVSELCNTTILALEKISTGYLQRWGGRRYNRSDTIEIGQLQTSSNAFETSEKNISARGKDLLVRISNFLASVGRKVPNSFSTSGVSQTLGVTVTNRSDFRSLT